MDRTGPQRTWTRRRFLAGGLGLAASAATGVGLSAAWQQLGQEDLIPGQPVQVPLEPERWRTTADHVSFAAIGDNGSGGRQAMAVAEQLALSYRDAPFGLVSLLGDICYYGPISQRFDEVFLKPLTPLIDAGVQFELAVGNHDGDLFFDEGAPDVEQTLQVLGTPGRFYSVTRGPARFFYLDSSILGLLGPDGSTQLEWLEDELASTEDRWRIVCLHHPLYSSGVHGSNLRLRRILEPLLVRRRVDLVLSGHDHDYERSVPVQGITHVVSGAGCKLTPVGRADHTAVARSTLQFLRVDIDGDRLTGRSIGADGGVIDRFDLMAGDRR